MRGYGSPLFLKELEEVSPRGQLVKNLKGEKMTELSVAEKPIYDALLGKVFEGDKEALDAEIQKVQDETGSINRASALRKLFRERGRREVQSNVTVAGYFLQQYQLRAGEDGESRYSVYLATPKGIQTIHIQDPKADLPSVKESGLTMKTFGERQKWTGLTEVENILYGNRSLHARRGQTKFAPASDTEITKKLGELSRPITQIEDGQFLWHAYISVIFPVGEFEGGELKGNKPILGTGGEAHARIGLTDEVDRKTGNPGNARTFVEITSEYQLRSLLGEYWDDGLLLSDDAFTELRDALKSTPVLVFGSGITPSNPRLNAQVRQRMKSPKIQLTNGRGLIVPYDWVS